MNYRFCFSLGIWGKWIQEDAWISKKSDTGTWFRQAVNGLIYN